MQPEQAKADLAERRDFAGAGDNEKQQNAYTKLTLK